jgi:hypothetical protein
MFVQPEQMDRITNAHCYSVCPTCTKHNIGGSFGLSKPRKLSFVCKAVSIVIKFINSVLKICRNNELVSQFKALSAVNCRKYVLNQGLS